MTFKALFFTSKIISRLFSNYKREKLVLSNANGEFSISRKSFFVYFHKTYQKLPFYLNFTYFKLPVCAFFQHQKDSLFVTPFTAM